MARKVTYSQWLEFVNKARDGGLKCDALNELKLCYPEEMAPGYDGIMLNELARLETRLIKKTIDKFQTTVNMGMEECDLEIVRAGIGEFKKNVANCFFFAQIQEYPVLIRKELCRQTTEKFEEFVVEYMNFVKRTGQYGDSVFFAELEYLCKKAKLNRFIEGYMYNG